MEDHSPSLTFLSAEKENEFLRRGEGYLTNIQRNHIFAKEELWQRAPTNKSSVYYYNPLLNTSYIYLYIYICGRDLPV